MRDIRQKAKRKHPLGSWASCKNKQIADPPVLDAKPNRKTVHRLLKMHQNEKRRKKRGNHANWCICCSSPNDAFRIRWIAEDETPSSNANGGNARIRGIWVVVGVAGFSGEETAQFCDVGGGKFRRQCIGLRKASESIYMVVPYCIWKSMKRSFHPNSVVPAAAGPHCWWANMLGRSMGAINAVGMGAL